MKNINKFKINTKAHNNLISKSLNISTLHSPKTKRLKLGIFAKKKDNTENYNSPTESQVNYDIKSVMPRKLKITYEVSP